MRFVDGHVPTSRWGQAFNPDVQSLAATQAKQPVTYVTAPLGQAVQSGGWCNQPYIFCGAELCRSAT